MCLNLTKKRWRPVHPVQIATGAIGTIYVRKIWISMDSRCWTSTFNPWLMHLIAALRIYLFGNDVQLSRLLSWLSMYVYSEIESLPCNCRMHWNALLRSLDNACQLHPRVPISQPSPQQTRHQRFRYDAWFCMLLHIHHLLNLSSMYSCKHMSR